MVDGDNHPFENMNGYDKAVRVSGVTVEVFVADKELFERYKKEYGVNTVLVPPGDQAVDNRIKAIAGDKARNREYDKMAIVSSDQGYRIKIKEWKAKYNLDAHDFILCKNIEGALSGA